MGQSTSNLVKKVSNWTAGTSTEGEKPYAGLSSEYLAKLAITPFVYQRQSPEYKDSDGDTADEFYEQQSISYKVPNGKKRKCRIVMQKVPKEQLKPVGMEPLKHPAFSVDYPLIICEAATIKQFSANQKNLR